MNEAKPLRRVSRVRHEPRRREVEVVRVQPIGKSFASITFGGDSLTDFQSDGFDDHVKFGFADQSGEMVKRDYTPRSYDPETRELTIEFLVHGHGEGSSWARGATVGSPAVISGPKNSMVIPLDYDWHMLIGDAAAIPAINRRLEELPEGTRAIVLIQIDDPEDRRDLASAASLEVRWVEAQDALVDGIRALGLPAGDGFVWGAGESGLMARLRDLIVNEKHHPREAMRLAAYWREGEGTFHQTLERGESLPAA